ncbi:uncharacterized protein STEHIDRAFT_145314 [Stereum hirsutum FP-91666 SS1]|uniref:uncharacterized protein n=1 Tax=Stereum hirsutum (strain FP-91666) TaxID=721885 RepID=UPI000440B9B2|nr:uncharacterized protein STEHIDRAFT_145314 [Stereum hirsutum FP-91666 SS1]EIM90179.1 hypothetical protein STEHIDRAFT_145314 [Stereum hirsutum FP-91666 SS1]
MFKSSAFLVALFVGSAYAVTAPTFVAPAAGPLVQSTNYTGLSNNTLTNSSWVAGKSFDRFIQIWLENTDFNVAASSPVFQELSKEAILLSELFSVTHPSEPNYIASLGGDFFGLGDDDYYHIPSNISSIIDILEDGGISWATYSENQPTDGYGGFNFSSVNYGNSSAADYAYYVRKHTPSTIFDSVAANTSRTNKIRNFNDFANDVVNGSLPQWIFVTPNMVNDAHDTTIDYASSWLSYWLIPLLNDTRFNDNKTLILLTFDENETYGVENRVYSLLLGGAVPSSLKGTTDSTFYSHYSSLSTVEANWDLPALGRGDVNTTMNNVYEFVASTTGWTNTNVTDKPLLNLTGIFAGPLNVEMYLPFTAPNLTAKGAGNGKIFTSPFLNTSITASNVGNSVNLTASGVTNPWVISTNAVTSNTTSSSSSSTSSSATEAVVLKTSVLGLFTVAAGVFAGVVLV